jgi:rubredoxin
MINAQRIHANKAASCRPSLFSSTRVSKGLKPFQRLLVRDAEPTQSAGPTVTDELEVESDTARKVAANERLRRAEKFLVIGSGSATCTSCGYEYKPEKGDPEYPVAPGMKFSEIPADYSCPICGSAKEKFNSQDKVVAGFAENQSYGFGTNAMTGDQKALLIYGALAFFFFCFIAGYGLQ